MIGIVPPMSFRRGQLEYFVAVVQEGQMTRAARKLHMAQPALSQAIASLEGELGIKLLERHARGVTLTEAGETFYERARAAVSASDEAIQTARALARAQEGTIEFGFLGSPPGLDSRAQLEAFALAYPEIDLRYRDLPFPSTPTSAWLADVDVAVCHLPPPDAAVWSHTLRREPRAVLAPRRHPLAERDGLEVEDVIDETFIGLDPAVDRGWAGFWSLDDHRGGPPENVTSDRASNPQEVLAALAVRSAITLVPTSVATIIQGFVSDVVGIPLSGAEHSRITMVGHIDRRNPLVTSLVNFARPTSPQPSAQGT
jgi:DNA-binding transcriptional LysR family regulator